MATPMSKWFKNKKSASQYRKRLIGGGYAKSRVYIKSGTFKSGSSKKPTKSKQYRVMQRKRI